ncbi:hypothetical protein CDAR_81391 [Caerostris darwini]|uniref:Uncharacterized protein n=1 Tax=Caerostris darwini TaxID=1538125 RepID=A0AAV4V8T9_9ARAC|nr:hypothetical protein CDAR_81391 [Caerostris darwini]
MASDQGRHVNECNHRPMHNPGSVVEASRLNNYKRPIKHPKFNEVNLHHVGKKPTAWNGTAGDLQMTTRLSESTDENGI